MKAGYSYFGDSCMSGLAMLLASQKGQENFCIVKYDGSEVYYDIECLYNESKFRVVKESGATRKEYVLSSDSELLYNIVNEELCFDDYAKIYCKYKY